MKSSFHSKEKSLAEGFEGKGGGGRKWGERQGVRYYFEREGCH
jgi:hypothetical protein